ncbi:ATP-binding protein [bacterium]|nr:ATP-binding protein [bacterium]
MEIKKIKKILKEIEGPYVVILIGPPLSGKDTFLKKLDLGESTKIVSRDQIILDLYEEDDYDNAFKSVSQKEVDKELDRQLTEFAEKGDNVIVNMTHMSPKRRIKNLNYFGSEYYKLAIIFPILNWEEYEKRNEKRKQEEKKFIPVNVIKDMISSYRPIREDENFDRVITLDEKW